MHINALYVEKNIAILVFRGIYVFSRDLSRFIDLLIRANSISVDPVTLKIMETSIFMSYLKRLRKVLRKSILLQVSLKRLLIVRWIFSQSR